MPQRAANCCSDGRAVRVGLLPKLAMAEGRDPRLMVVILRGALDGLAAVAPVGDPDWRKLRGDERSRCDAPGRRCRSTAVCAQSGDAEPASALSGQAGRDRARGGDAPIASARISTVRTCSKAVARAGAIDTGWLNRALAALAPANAAIRVAVRLSRSVR